MSDNTVPKKITLNLNEEIELTEREEQIYEAGEKSGKLDVIFIFLLFVLLIVTTFVIYILKHG